MFKKSFLSILVASIIIVSGCSQTPEQKQQTQSSSATTRTYYIAAEEVTWDYAPTGKSPTDNAPLPEPWGQQTKYQKVRFVEYTDETFTQKKEQPQWLGILGPIIRGVEGDTIKVHFYNKAQKSYSMHPHGLTYSKANEGAAHGNHEDGENHQMDGNEVAPGSKYTYEWFVSAKAAPNEKEGSSKVWLYHSHVAPVEDIYEGLMGPIIITAKDKATAEGLPNDVDQEFITLFFVHNESTEDMPEEEVEGHLKHAINGYIFDNLPGLEMKKNDKVRWHLLALGTEVDLHTAHWHGEVVEYQGYNTDVVELLPASMKSVDMIAENVGTWMFHCHVTDHITAGMHAMYTIKE